MNRYRAARARRIAVLLVAFHRTASSSHLAGIPLSLIGAPAWRERHVLRPAVRHARRRAARRAS